MSNSFLDRLVGGEAIRSDLYISVADSYEAEFLEALKELTDGDYDISRTSKIEARRSMNDSRMLLFVLGGGIALVLGLIGILNFINVMSVGVLVRKRELAALESIGMTRRQIRAMLLWEGIGYGCISLLSALTVGSAVTYGIFTMFKQQADYAVFTFPFLPVLIAALVVAAVCLATPGVVYRGIAKSTVVERLRGAE
jgi:putative ABC transport system permease protein